jgi:hypothetical protein
LGTAEKRAAGYFVVAMRKRSQAGQTWKICAKIVFLDF